MVKGELTLDNTLGAVFVGNVIAAILYGITLLQTFVFYKKQYEDHILFKAVIYFLCLLDTLHIALVTVCMYVLLVRNFNNLFALLSPHWSILASVYLTCMSDAIVRIIYARRVWTISGRSRVIIGLIGLTTLGALCGGFAYATRAFSLKTYARLTEISYLMYLSLGSAVIADVLIAGTICVNLARTRTGCKTTDSIVNVLILYSINSGLLTTICCVTCFITYALWPHEFIFIGIYVCLSKLFLTNLMAMLNARGMLKARVHGLSEVAVQGLSNISPQSPNALSNFPPTTSRSGGGGTGSRGIWDSSLRSSAEYNLRSEDGDSEWKESGDDGEDDHTRSTTSVRVYGNSQLSSKPSIRTAVMITYDRHVEIGEAM